MRPPIAETTHFIRTRMYRASPLALPSDFCSSAQHLSPTAIPTLTRRKERPVPSGSPRYLGREIINLPSDSPPLLNRRPLRFQKTALQTVVQDRATHQHVHLWPVVHCRVRRQHVDVLRLHAPCDEDGGCRGRSWLSSGARAAPTLLPLTLRGPIDGTSFEWIDPFPTGTSDH